MEIYAVIDVAKSSCNKFKRIILKEAVSGC